MQDLIQSGKTEYEMTRDLETYYYMLVENCDNEIVDLREHLEVEKAGFREEAAEEVYLKAHEIDDLSNIFIDCIHAHRKSLRNELIRIKVNSNKQQLDLSQMSEDSNKKPNLLDTYLKIVQTGAPEEIEKFS